MSMGPRDEDTGEPWRANEADAYAFLERLRWSDDGPTVCPHCNSTKGAWYLQPKNPEGRKSKGGSSSRSQRRVWKCRENSCRRQFSVLTNTVLHATKMPVRAWIDTVVSLCNDPHGVSARDIAKRWGVAEKSAWAMLNRIREALAQPEAAGALLALNAPLWVEVTATEQAQIRHAEQAQKRAVAEAEMRRIEEANLIAARIESDVQRALREAIGQHESAAESPPDRRDFEPTARPVSQPASTPSGVSGGPIPRRESASSELDLGSDTKPVSTPSGVSGGPIPRRESASGELDAGSDTEPSSRLAEGAKRPDPVAEDQVKSDVERALAEAFSEPYSPPEPARVSTADRVDQRPERAPEDRKNRDQKPARDAAESDVRQERSRPEKPAPTDQNSRATSPKNRHRSKRRKGSKPGRADGAKGPMLRRPRNPQAVDNSAQETIKKPRKTPPGPPERSARGNKESDHTSTKRTHPGPSEGGDASLVEGRRGTSNARSTASDLGRDSGQTGPDASARIGRIPSSALGPAWAKSEPQHAPDSPLQKGSLRKNSSGHEPTDEPMASPVGDRSNPSSPSRPTGPSSTSKGVRSVG